MNGSENICPYTGLRSFSEDESLYFKGRDEQILQVTSQLQQRKFLMVTGASGDGKSSLIFAGLIPQAKAGFFKARYSNWQVADFRPERSPIKNMANALSRALNFDAETIEVELSRGFSSLVDLYKTSDRFADQTSSSWNNADEEGRQQMERQASNLIILIDQFEEFFTNPENFPGGVPSQEARLLMNIILETAKISLKEDLPIYIICTMRSDYIGQCAAFRGLPEFIGFSQFFVPRLQRKELYQIIEEPAILSGNRISKRLIERLIVDVELETDQLPILQHALKEIWKAADSGNTEMDLIHYAMVGGMEGEKLPSESFEEFQSWKKSLDDQQLQFLESPGLANVLDIHANKLFNQAAGFCQKNGFPQIQNKDARFILAMTFACLTRIDESRAVRNRMTLQEITNIINVPKYNHETVGAVLSVFRLSENTLVRPYVENQDQLRNLDKDSVLDITHEALIRNWKKLRQWANQEYEYYNTFLDFNQQVNRWKDHGKSNDFLLPIGPLTYFEDWYKNCRPNKYWISRYNTHEPDKDIRLGEADRKLKDGKEFLRKSSLQLLVTRTVMKYGAGKITALVTGFLILILASVVFHNWRIRQNDYVVETILKETEAFAADRELIDLDLAYFLSCVEQYKPGSFRNNLEKMPFELKVNTSLNFLNNFLFTGNETLPPAIVKENLFYADSLLLNYQSLMDADNISSVMEYMGWKTRLIRNLFFYDFFWPDKEIAELRNKNIPHLTDLVINAFSLEEQMSQMDFKELHIGLTLALNMQGLDDDQIATLINKMSPFESSASEAFFNKWFPFGRTIPVGFGTNISHNGGYQTLAYLYASIGEPQLAMRSVDSLRKYNRSYNQLEDANSLNIVPYFLIYEKEEALGEFAHLDASRMNIPVVDYLNQAFMRSGVNDNNTGVGLFRAVNVNDNYLLIDAERRLTLFQIIHRKIIDSDLAPDESNFKLALLYKLSGILEDKYNRVKKWNATPKTDSLFEIAIQYYQSVDPEFLQEKVEKEIQVWMFQQSEKRTIKRNDLFIYPGYRKEVAPPIRMSEFNYYSDGFFQFLFKNKKLRDFYKSREDYVLISEWISTYFQWYDGSGRAHMFSIYPGTIAKVDSMLSNSGFVLENAWTKMKLAMDFFEVGDTINAFQSVEDIYIETFNKTTNSFYFQNLVIQVAMECAIRGRLENARSLIGNFNSPRNRITAYSAIAARSYSNEKFSEARAFYDSALVEMNKLEDLGGDEFNDFRVELVRYLALQNSDESTALAFEYIGSMDWAARTWGVRIMGYSLGSLGNYYDAWNLLPENSSSTDRIRLATDVILLFENKKLARPEWKEILKADEIWQQFVRTENDLIAR